MFAAVFVVVILIILFLGLNHAWSEKKNTSWIQFFAKGKDSGFSMKEIELLRRLATRCNIEDPCSLYWSQNQLDICIRSLVRTMRMAGGEEEGADQDFLSKLYDFRKKVEINNSRNKNGIGSSRQIDDGQILRILVPGTGVFRSQVVKNAPGYLTISRPVSEKITNMSWNGARLSVYFWREDDAGYVFDSDVQDEVFSRGISSLKISHGDSLFRTQKRKGIRVKTHKSAYLYMLKQNEEPGMIEQVPGLKCFIEDLSDGGCAIMVGGKANDGLRVKVQFAVDNAAVSMSGTIRSSDFHDDTNRSLLHMEADPMPMGTRNRILAEVFGMLPETDEEELPFRILDEEAAGAKNVPELQGEPVPNSM